MTSMGATNEAPRKQSFSTATPLITIYLKTRQAVTNPVIDISNEAGTGDLVRRIKRASEEEIALG